MAEFSIILNKLIMFAIILAVGAFAAKMGVITRDMMPGISRIISKVLLPMFVFINIAREGSVQLLIENFTMLPWSVLVYGLIILAAFLMAKVMRMGREHGNVFQAMYVFGVAGFIGIPLVFALFPEKGPMYMAWFTIIDQPLLWTYGIYLTSGEKKLQPKRFLNPSIYAVFLGILCLVVGLKLPDIIVTTLDTAGGASVPVCMIYLGAMLYFEKPFWVLKKADIYVGMAVKNLLLPVAIGYLLPLLGADRDMTLTLVILASLPTMTVIPMLVPESSPEKGFAIGGGLVSILFSLVTIPIVMLLINL